MESIKELAEKAVALQPTDRIKLVEAILFSLDNPDTEIEKAWISEAELRYEAYKRGEIEASNWEEIKKKYNH